MGRCQSGSVCLRNCLEISVLGRVAEIVRQSSSTVTWLRCWVPCQAGSKGGGRWSIEQACVLARIMLLHDQSSSVSKQLPRLFYSGVCSGRSFFRSRGMLEIDGSYGEG